MHRTLRLLSLVSAIGLAGGCASTSLQRSIERGSATVGNLDSKWSPYAAYLQRAIDRVQRQWESEIIESRVSPSWTGTVVTVAFWVSADGRVSRIEEVTSVPENAAAKFCVSAIARKGTFDPWTAGMKDSLGAEEKMTFNFRYEDEPAKKPNKALDPTPGRGSS